ncbi:MAG: SpoVA/SpoVAEb family sporulation membrane protein [Clostridia bacterium]|nr:SpoVA/SpoVAEb family sporulation membrane protein [Clostridia bacterium]
MDNLYELLAVFVAGGVLCAIAQILIDMTKITPARILVLYVCLGVLLYGVGVYDFLFDIFGAGVSIPLIGFGVNIGKGVKEAVESEGLLGALKGGITASAAGITAALLCGFVASVISKPKAKRM